MAQRDRIGLVADVYARRFALNGLGAADVARLGSQGLDRIAAHSPEPSDRFEPCPAAGVRGQTPLGDAGAGAAV